MISISRLPLDFKETVGQNEAKKEEFCDSQKDQVQKFAQMIRTNMKLQPNLSSRSRNSWTRTLATFGTAACARGA